VEGGGGGGGLTVSGVSRNRGGFVKCVAIQKRLGIPALKHGGRTFFFPRAKNSFPVGLKGQESPPGTIF
jgi:hypothetical protein